MARGCPDIRYSLPDVRPLCLFNSTGALLLTIAPTGIGYPVALRNDLIDVISLAHYVCSGEIYRHQTSGIYRMSGHSARPYKFWEFGDRTGSSPYSSPTPDSQLNAAAAGSALLGRSPSDSIAPLGLRSPLSEVPLLSISSLHPIRFLVLGLHFERLGGSSCI